MQRYNTDLANTLGNLLNRTLSMVAKYRSGILTRSAASQASLSVEGKDVPAERFRTVSVDMATTLYGSHLDDAQVQDGLAVAFELANGCNRSIDATKLWALAKAPEQAVLLDAVLYDLAESLRHHRHSDQPSPPKSSEAIFAQLNWTGPIASAKPCG